MSTCWDEPPTPHQLAARYDTAPRTHHAEDLPEVLRLVDDGWWLAPEAPIWFAVVAAWPPALRTWIPDRSDPHMRFGVVDGPSGEAPLPPGEVAMLRQDAVQGLADVGIPEPPADRRWLLRSPADDASVPELVERLFADLEREGGSPADLATLRAYVTRRTASE